MEQGGGGEGGGGNHLCSKTDIVTFSEQLQGIIFFKQ